MTVATPAYPFGLELDPQTPQGRLSVVLRIIYIIPIAVVTMLVGISAGVLTILAWFVVLFTGRYPAGFAAFVLNFWRMGTAVQCYGWLLTDKYPAFSPSEAGVAPYPIRPFGEVQLEGRNRLTVAFRLIMVVPHWIIIYFLDIAGQAIAAVCWFFLLFTGTMPDGMRNFLAGWQRWSARVSAYLLLLTDTYPPFSLD